MNEAFIWVSGLHFIDNFLLLLARNFSLKLIPHMGPEKKNNNTRCEVVKKNNKIKK